MGQAGTGEADQVHQKWQFLRWFVADRQIDAHLPRRGIAERIALEYAAVNEEATDLAGGSGLVPAHA